MSIITREALERCKQKTLTEQLEQVRKEMREEFSAVHLDLRSVTIHARQTSDRVGKLEQRL